MMNTSKMTLFSCILIAVLATVALRTGVARATSFNYGSWSIVPSPNPGTIDNTLDGVTAISASNVWAAGDYSNISGITQSLIEQWNGTSWEVISSPNPGSRYNNLYGIAAVSANSVWAVGVTGPDSSGTSQTLIEYWNGTSWSVVPSPSPGGGGSFLSAIAVTSANDIWAVGYMYNNNPIIQTLIEHWNGTSWSAVPSPNPGQGNVLSAVAAISTNDVWAVGRYYNAGSSSYQTLAEHWDGDCWSVVSSPNPGAGFNYLYGVAPVSGKSGKVWAVGTYVNTSTNTFQTLIEKWSGKSWEVISSPNVGSGDNVLDGGITSVSADNVWAVGRYNSSTGGYTLIEHWDGTSWSVVSSTYPGLLAAVASVPRTSGQVWAVGRNSGNQTLTEFYC
jgi:hypothetical protein